MFVKEAKLVADLVHENIVQIYQLGRDQTGYYIVMEYVHGQSLHEFIRFHNSILRTSPPLELSVFIASRVARGLAYAHSRLDRNGALLDIVHRDVCPNNIMITTEGLPKLADFGIAIVSSDMMHEGQLMGKLSYMSPQQARRETVDFRADIFSLGACLFEMITGKKMRFSPDEEEFASMAENGAVDWDLLPDDLPSDVREILEKCMDFNPENRFETSSELAKSLEYVIYKDGYGPTIQTLEAYLRTQMPYLYNMRRPQTPILSSGTDRTPITASVKKSKD
jgi:serine/threonine protein kinase